MVSNAPILKCSKNGHHWTKVKTIRQNTCVAHLSSHVGAYLCPKTLLFNVHNNKLGLGDPEINPDWKSIYLKRKCAVELQSNQPFVLISVRYVQSCSYFEIYFFVASKRIIWNFCKIGFMPTGPCKDLGWMRNEAQKKPIRSVPINFFRIIYLPGTKISPIHISLKLLPAKIHNLMRGLFLFLRWTQLIEEQI